MLVRILIGMAAIWAICLVAFIVMVHNAAEYDPEWDELPRKKPASEDDDRRFEE